MLLLLKYFKWYRIDLAYSTLCYCTSSLLSCCCGFDNPFTPPPSNTDVGSFFLALSAFFYGHCCCAGGCTRCQSQCGQISFEEDAALSEMSRTVCGLVTPAGYREAHGRHGGMRSNYRQRAPLLNTTTLLFIWCYIFILSVMWEPVFDILSIFIIVGIESCNMTILVLVYFNHIIIPQWCTDIL